MELPPYTLSRRAPSTARPPLRNAPQAGAQRDSSRASRRGERGPDTSLPGREQGPRVLPVTRRDLAENGLSWRNRESPRGPPAAEGPPTLRPAPPAGGE